MVFITGQNVSASETETIDLFFCGNNVQRHKQTKNTQKQSKDDHDLDVN